MGIQVISFKCVLKNKAGQFISTTYNRDVLTSSADQELQLAGLAEGLKNLTKGEKRCIELKAEEAYGLYHPDKVILFPRKKLPKTIALGQVVTIVGKSGRARSYKVVELHSDLVSLDGNHPLAGQDLIFEIETLEARDATNEEIAQSKNTVNTQVLH